MYDDDPRGTRTLSRITFKTVSSANHPLITNLPMSTHPPKNATDPEVSTGNRQFRTRNAPRTFDPFNTNPCPEMFSDKWQAVDDS